MMNGLIIIDIPGSIITFCGKAKNISWITGSQTDSRLWMNVGTIVIVNGPWKFRGYNGNFSNIGIIISVQGDWALIDFGRESATLIKGSFRILE